MSNRKSSALHAMHWKSLLRVVPRIRRYGMIVSLALLFACFALLRPSVFPTLGNLIAILKQISLLGILSAGLTVCLVLGDFDLSVAAVATWSGVMIAALLPQMNMWLAMPVVLSMGVGIGLVNGFFSAVVGISPFIVTLATQTILRGLTLWYTGGYSLYSGIPLAFVRIGRGTFLPRAPGRCSLHRNAEQRPCHSWSAILPAVCDPGSDPRSRDRCVRLCSVEPPPEDAVNETCVPR